MLTQTKKAIAVTRNSYSPKSQTKKLYAKWILVENKLTCIWCNEN